MDSDLKGVDLLRSLLHKMLTIKLTDGRTLVGQFLCVDQDGNIIIGSAAEYSCENLSDDPRVLGLAMIKKTDTVSIKVKKNDLTTM